MSQASFIAGALSLVLPIAAVALMSRVADAAPMLSNGSLTGPIANAAVPPGWATIAGSPDTMDQTHNVGLAGTPFVVAPSGPSPDGGTWIGFARDHAASFTEAFGQSVSGFQVGSPYNISWYEGNFGAQTGAGYNQPNRISVTANNVFVGAGAPIALSSGWTLD